MVRPSSAALLQIDSRSASPSPFPSPLVDRVTPTIDFSELACSTTSNTLCCDTCPLVEGGSMAKACMRSFGGMPRLEAFCCFALPGEKMDEGPSCDSPSFGTQYFARAALASSAALVLSSDVTERELKGGMLMTDWEMPCLSMKASFVAREGEPMLSSWSSDGGEDELRAAETSEVSRGGV